MDFSKLENLIKGVEERYKKEKKDFIDNIQKNTEYPDFEGDIEELNVIYSLLSFLKYEKENIMYKIKNRLPLKTYNILDEYIDFTSAFLGVYYNTDTGASYDDIENILKELLFELLESKRLEQE